MAVNGDVEKGESWGADSMKEPLIRNEKIASYEENSARRNDGESIGMVLFSTFVAVCGSFEFGSCVGYSAPTQSSIRKDLDLSLPQMLLHCLHRERIWPRRNRALCSYCRHLFQSQRWLMLRQRSKARRFGLAWVAQLAMLSGQKVEIVNISVWEHRRVQSPPNSQIMMRMIDHSDESGEDHKYHSGMATRSPRLNLADEEQNNTDLYRFRFGGTVKGQSFVLQSLPAAYRDEWKITSAGSQSHVVTLLPLWRGRIGCPPSAIVVPRCVDPAGEDPAFELVCLLGLEASICNAFTAAFVVGAIYMGAISMGLTYVFGVPTFSGGLVDRAMFSLDFLEFCNFGTNTHLGSLLTDVGAVPLDIGRFLTGFGIGIFSYVIPVFIAELAPKNIRGGLATLNQLMIVTGSSVAFLIGTVVTWRTLALTGIIPCLVLLLGLFFIPESPRWLAKVGRQKEFEIALQRLRGKNTDVSFEAAEIQDYIESLNNSPKVQVLDLFQTKYIRSLIIGVGLMVFQQFGGINGISFYASQTFESAGASSGKIGTIAYACIQVPITLLGAVLMDKSGRRALLTVSASGTFLGCLLAGLSFFLKAHAMLLQWVPFLAIAGVLVYIGSFSIGMGATPWVIMSEIFPINVKGVAGSFVTLVNWIGAWVISYTFNFLMSWSSSGTFFLYSGVSLVTILFVAKFVPETKGRTLEEIQASINS
ncbi:hypothetical protein Syun_007759 [Stephania yunnanensis]|uniref:Major facilitator superfamily (MFS) profile domain-containing protein n=1 Tax=Stephania yunnanensis TaxID=152371 RepID=A0AAP0L0I1_9MAGN